MSESKRRHKHEKPHSISFALFAGSIVPIVITTAYCVAMFSVIWKVLDDPVAYPGLFPLRIDTFVLALFLIALLYGLARLSLLERQFSRLARAYLSMRKADGSVSLQSIYDGKAVGHHHNAYAIEVDYAASVLRQKDYFLPIATYVLAAVLPWNLWGVSRD